MVTGLGSDPEDGYRGPTFRIQGLGSRVPPKRWVLGIGSWVSPEAPVLRSHFWDIPFLLSVELLTT